MSKTCLPVQTIGWLNPFDGGGGMFYWNGTMNCADQTVTLSKKADGNYWDPGDTVINVTSVAGISAHMYTSVTNVGRAPGLPVLDQVAIVGSTTITLAVPVFTVNPSMGTISVNLENGGLKIAGTDGACFNRTQQSFSQMEWGVGVGVFSGLQPDDTSYLQNWINSPQAHIAQPGTAVLTSPIVCNDEQVVQGAPSTGVAEDPTNQPAFVIKGSNSLYAPYYGLSFSSTSTQNAAMLTMVGSCGLHAIGLVADNQTHGFYDVVHANGKSDVIDQHSYLANGYYNVVAGAAGTAPVNGTANLELYDSSFNNSYSDNVIVYSPNAKLMRNSFAGAGSGSDGTATISGDNIRFGGVDIVIADNIIQQAAGWGVDLVSARSVRIHGNFFDNNGRMIVDTTNAASPLGTGALRIFKSGHVTVCTNTFSESASAFENNTATTPIAGAAHITFSGNNDTVSLCGNVYLPIATSASNGTNGSSLSSVLIHPDYDYDAVNADGTTPVLTNITIADNAAPQNIGVFSPGAAMALAGQNVTPVPSYTNGLKLTYGSPTTVNVAPGRATDSTVASLILLPVQCTIKSSSVGAGGLDAPGGIAANATYNVFLISGPGGSNPSCMASLSAAPSFLNAGPLYAMSTQGMTVAGSNMIYNVGQTVTTNPDGTTHYSGPNNLTMNPLAGMAVGDVITGTNIPATTITSLQAFNANNINTNITGSATDCIKLPNIISATTLVGFNIAGPVILPGTYITGATTCTASSHYHYQLSQAPSGPATSVNIAIGGDFTITTSAPATTTSSLGPPFVPSALTVYVGLFTLVGQFTTGGTGKITPF